jgi:H+/Cl- antiporter ClcA
MLQGRPGECDVTQNSEISDPGDYSMPRWLPLLAHVSLLYPLLPAILLYGEWLLARYMLGHIPRPSADDPKFIDGSSWMHPLVSLAFVGLIPGFFVALLLNLVYLADDKTGWRRRMLRIAAFLILWAGLVVLLVSDPGRVVYWWLD